jgi:hypothetical protein
MTDFTARLEDRFQPPLYVPELRKLRWEVTVRLRAIVAFYVLLMAVFTAIVIGRTHGQRRRRMSCMSP